MGLRSDLKGGTSFNTSAGGNTQDNKVSYSVSASSNSGNYGDLNQISGYGSYNSEYGPLGLSASLAMTTVNNILPPIAVAWYCIQGHRICAVEYW